MTEKNAGSRANNAAESLRQWVPPALVFVVVLLVMFWRLGSYPPYFNDMVDHGIHMEVNKVFDHVDISNKVNWYWKDMHSRGAYQSPLYGMVIETWATALRAYLVRRSFLSCLDRIWGSDPYVFRFQEILSTVPSAQFHTADGAVAMAFAVRAVRRDSGVQRQPVSNRVVHVCPAY